MSDRRSLIEGLKPKSEADLALEASFVYQNPPKPSVEGTDVVQETATLKSAGPVGRMPLTTRLRGDLAAGLKRASLQRQLNGISPNTMQDIVEEALEPWLRSNGFLP